MIYKKIDISILPDSVSEDLAKAWIDHRIAIKKPLTPYAFKLCMRSAERVSRELSVTPDWAIETTLENGWQGIRSEYLQKFTASLNISTNKTTREMTLEDEASRKWSH